MTTGDRIRNAREDKDILQQELANAINMNVSVLNRIEKGTRPIRDDELIRIARALQVSTDYLLGTSRELARDRGYYHDPEVVSIANEMKENPDIRVLFDATRGLKKESIEEVRRFVEFQKAKERGDYE